MRTRAAFTQLNAFTIIREEEDWTSATFLHIRSSGSCVVPGAPCLMSGLFARASFFRSLCLSFNLARQSNPRNRTTLP
mgnify:FL=1